MPGAGDKRGATGGRDPFSGWRPRSLRARQLLAASLGLVAFLALAGYALDRAFVETAERNLRERLESYANAYANDIDFDRGGAVIDYEVVNSPPDPRFLQPGSGLYTQIVLPSGYWVTISGEGPALPQGRMLAAPQQVFDGPLPVTQIDGSAGEVYRYGRGLVWKDEFPYTIYVMEDTRALAGQLRVFRGALWSYLGGAGVILLLLQMAVLRWSLRPLNRVVAELARVQHGQLSRMSDRHPRELEPLTESINVLIDSERENLERQRNTLADLAHSLKTPLAVLRAQLDEGVHAIALRDELDTQLRKMNNLVSYQLARAASGGHKLFAAPVAIEPNAEEIVRGLEKVYAAKGVICEFEIDPSAQFHGEIGDLQELLGNLLENAFKWARSRVLLTAQPRLDSAHRRAGLLLAVEDDGPGIAEEDVARILQRGVRGDERVQGHGIGLGIVQDLIRDYRGELQVVRSQELGGACFIVTLPPNL
ncbi:two-component sensor histidine kinase [Pseudoxanthomonas kalamensis DSM 18571]|uniref:ATP-binding protein n=1 Tax=Pseudoxanthomonas kalamensis TaxID=289483 RepID=UPI0013920BF2|nr:sensor histidine kinase [Pseudoxanthomonas kalamensis]KAF1711980.1 two-component sensor histidine kinase [Pseudoxanthomonas kalamensis DSM 18571]